MVAEGETFNPHDFTLFYHVAVLAWTQFSSTENVSFSIGPLGIWASKLGMFGGQEQWHLLKKVLPHGQLKAE